MIEIKDLTKKFGDFTAVDHLSMTIKTGEFFGLLGPNGAGKTTTISMMSTVLLPTSGEIYIDGKKLDRKASAEKTGDRGGFRILKLRKPDRTCYRSCG